MKIKGSRLRCLLLATAGTVGMLAAVVTPASAATPYSVDLPDGTVVSLDRPFDSYSPDELDALGIAPGEHGILEATVGSSTRSSGMQPASAHGCNGRVCITIDGTGWVVAGWSTSLTPDHNGPTRANFWEGSTLSAQTDTFSVDTSKDYWAKLNLSMRFSADIQLCNTWDSFSGRPCEFVHQ